MKAVILCAGRGTRLGDLTKDLPKPMVPINGKPLLEYTIQYLSVQGFKEIAINLYHKPEKVKEYFGDGTSFGVSITYFEETELLGTAGALSKMREWLGDDEEFVVLYGDLLINQNLLEMQQFHHQKSGLATLLLHQRVRSNSLVEMDDNGRITDFIERPNRAQRQKAHYPWVNSGVGIFNKKILEFVPMQSPSDLPRDIYSKIVKFEPVYGFPLTGYRCAIDSPTRYEMANNAVKSGEYKLGEWEYE